MMRRSAPRQGRRLLALALLPLSVLCSFGCNDNDEGNGMMAEPCLDFATSVLPSPGTVVATDGLDSTCDLAVIDLIVTDVDDLFGTSFTVNFDGSLVRFLGLISIGSVLGSNIDVVSSEVAVGEVSVGITRRRPDPGVDVVGGQLLIRMSFSRLGTSTASSSLTFAGAELFDSAEPPIAIPGITFSGGSLTITVN